MAEPMKIRATLQGDVADVRILMMHPDGNRAAQGCQGRDRAAALHPERGGHAQRQDGARRAVEPGRFAQPVPRPARQGRQGRRQDQRDLDRQQGRQAHRRSNRGRRHPEAERGRLDDHDEEEIMPKTRGGVAAIAVACLAAWGAAAAARRSPATRSRSGARCWPRTIPANCGSSGARRSSTRSAAPRARRSSSAISAWGRASSKAPRARLPRYFADTDQVQDLESRLLHLHGRAAGIQARGRREAGDQPRRRATAPTSKRSRSTSLPGRTG